MQVVLNLPTPRFPCVMFPFLFFVVDVAGVAGARDCGHHRPCERLQACRGGRGFRKDVLGPIAAAAAAAAAAGAGATRRANSEQGARQNKPGLCDESTRIHRSAHACEISIGRLNGAATLRFFRRLRPLSVRSPARPSVRSLRHFLYFAWGVTASNGVSFFVRVFCRGPCVLSDEMGCGRRRQMEEW